MDTPISMIQNFIKLILAFGGIFLGSYLIVLAYTTKLGSSALNNIVIIAGFIIASSSGLYLTIKILKKLIKQ